MRWRLPTACWLAAARNRPTAIAITGEPGGGKTTLALLLLYLGGKSERRQRDLEQIRGALYRMR